MLTVHEVKEKQHAWGSIIKKMRLSNDALDYFKTILQLCLNKNHNVKQSYQAYFAHAFASLLDKLNKSGKYNGLNRFDFDTKSLMHFTNICGENTSSESLKICLYNTILNYAGGAKKYTWFFELYHQMISNKLADGVTLGVAIKIYGTLGKLTDAEKVFKFLFRMESVSVDQLQKGIGSIIQACCSNHAYQKARDYFKLADEDERGLTNAVILTTMIKVAMATNNLEEGTIFWERARTYPDAKQSEIDRALAHYENLCQTLKTSEEFATPVETVFIPHEEPAASPRASFSPLKASPVELGVFKKKPGENSPRWETPWITTRPEEEYVSPRGSAFTLSVV